MLRNILMTGVAVLVLLGAIVGCAVDVEQPPEPANVEVEQPPEPAPVDLVQPAEETNTFSIKGWVTVDAYHYDKATGTYVLFYHHESSNLVVNIGKDWVEVQLGGTPGASAHWISLSTSTAALDPTWTVIPTEITADGLERASGTFDGTPGTGQWTITHTFNATGTHTNVQLTGLNWGAGPPPDSTLFAANTFDPVSLSSGDSLTVTWTLTVT